MMRVDIGATTDAEPHIGLLLDVLENTTREWTRELGDVSIEQIIWQPFPGGHSIGGLILHIADVEASWLHQVAAGQTRTAEEKRALLSEETKQYAVQWPTPPSQPLTWYLERHAEVRARTKQLVPALPDLDHIGMRRGDEFTLRWLLAHVITHEAYHGGQAVLLSLMQQAQANNMPGNKA